MRVGKTVKMASVGGMPDDSILLKGCNSWSPRLQEHLDSTILSGICSSSSSSTGQ